MNDETKDPWMGPERPAAAPKAAAGPQWERDMIERLAFGALQEQRRRRRWNIFFMSLFFVYLFTVLIMATSGDEFGDDGGRHGRHTALVEIRGVISDDSEASADHIVSGLRAAFKNKHAAGVILRINSPGGSPVQAGYVNDEITRLRREYPDKHLYAVITDICASGGYYIAAAADEIFADKASIVGSIGVRMDGFGFVGSMEKLGVERRLMTAGESKGFMDPFSPLKEADVDHVRTLLGTIHQQFIEVVRRGRGDRLKEDAQLFSGLIWTGEQGLELGLVDGLASSAYVARELIGAEKIVDYTYEVPIFDRMVKRLGVALADGVTARFEGQLR